MSVNFYTTSKQTDTSISRILLNKKNRCKFNLYGNRRVRLFRRNIEVQALCRTTSILAGRKLDFFQADSSEIKGFWSTNSLEKFFKI